MKKFLLSMALCVCLASCTANERAKTWGGTMTVTLPKNTKLINATWKESQLWYLTRPMQTDEIAERYEFKEQSGFGVLEGTVIFQEHKE